MKIHLYNTVLSGGTKLIAEVVELPEIIYVFSDETKSYRFYRRGSARNSVTYYETNALHVTNAVEVK